MSISISVNYGGLVLRSPIVVGACPLTENEQSRFAMESAGAGAIVLPSLFEEHVIRWSQKFGRPLSPREQDLLECAGKHSVRSDIGSDAETYLSLVNRAGAQQSIPVIASLNGYTAGGWADFAGELQEAGAGGVELNIHHPSTRDYDGPRALEDEMLEMIQDVNAAISIPLFVKLGRNFTSMPHLARRLLSGVQGLVMHGRSPDVDICLDSIRLNTAWGLTASGSITQSLGRILQVHSYCPALPIAASGGIGSPEDVIKSLLAGADVAMITSAVYRNGPDVIRNLCDGLIHFMKRHQLSSMADLQRIRPIEFANPEERRSYMAALSARTNALATHDTVGPVRGDRFGHPTRLQ